MDYRLAATSEQIAASSTSGMLSLLLFGPLLHSLFIVFLQGGLTNAASDRFGTPVVLRVQVVAYGDHSRLPQATVVVWGNHSSLNSSTTGKDGIAVVTFPYLVGTRTIVTAAKRGYVTNSAPWRASRIPLYSSLSLQLLPEREATITVYQEQQVLLWEPGGRGNARMWLRTPSSNLNSSNPALSTDITTILTVPPIHPQLLTTRPQHIQLDDLMTRTTHIQQEDLTTTLAFPHTQSQLEEGKSRTTHIPPDNPTTPTTHTQLEDLRASLTSSHTHSQLATFPFPLGLDPNSTGVVWLELSPIAAVSIQLSSLNGSRVQVKAPVHISIPLPTDSPLSTAITAPLWTLQDTAGVWVHNGSSYIRKEGDQLIWNFTAPHLGYWLAAFPPNNGVVEGEISFYHSIFLLSILGSLVLLVLLLLCLLVYHCRRRCLKPKRRRSKPVAGRHRNPQSSTTARDSSRHRDRGTSASLHHPVHPPRYHDKAPGHSSNFTSLLSSDASRPPNYSAPLPPPSLSSSLTSPLPPSLTSPTPPSVPPKPTTSPGQLVICSSLDQMRESLAGSLVPTLVIPAHYLGLNPDSARFIKMNPDPAHFLNLTPHSSHYVNINPSMTSELAGRAGTELQQHEGEGLQNKGEGPQRKGEWLRKGSWTLPRNKSSQRDRDQEQEHRPHPNGNKPQPHDDKPQPQAWFVSLDGRSNSPLHRSYLETSGIEGGLEGGGGGERNGGMGGRKADVLMIHRQPPSISLAQPGDKQEVDWPQNRSGTFPRPRRCRDPTPRPGSTPSPDEDLSEDKEEDGENRKSQWQKREERPLIVFK